MVWWSSLQNCSFARPGSYPGQLLLWNYQELSGLVSNSNLRSQNLGHDTRTAKSADSADSADNVSGAFYARRHLLLELIFTQFSSITWQVLGTHGKEVESNP